MMTSHLLRLVGFCCALFFLVAPVDVSNALDLVITATNHTTLDVSHNNNDGAMGLLGDDSSRRPPEAVVLYSDQSLSPGQYRYSPSGMFRVGMLTNGELVLEDLSLLNMMAETTSTATTTATAAAASPVLLWSSKMTRSHSTPANSNNKCNLQADGNLVVRNVETRQRVWSSHTFGFPGSRLVIDDGGQLAIRTADDHQRVWYAGLPRDYYNSTPSESLSFPIRGTFYYPWYPETFVVGGRTSHFQPSLGWYSSSDPNVARNHIESMDYAHIDVSIASWWGPDTHLDRPRLTMLLDMTLQMKSSLKWTVYYEQEMKKDRSVIEIRQDLNYLSTWFARHPVWARVDDRPLIFVYNGGDDMDSTGCEVIERWMEASQGEWYVVLKVFKDFDECPIQPDHWHQYGSGDDGVVRNRGFSYVVSPGFWKASNSRPRVPRLAATTYCQNVEKMSQSGDPWQLVLSFNEAGEGTMIEASSHWASGTKYGQFLDCLHGIVPTSRSHETLSRWGALGMVGAILSGFLVIA